MRVRNHRKSNTVINQNPREACLRRQSRRSRACRTRPRSLPARGSNPQLAGVLAPSLPLTLLRAPWRDSFKSLRVNFFANETKKKKGPNATDNATSVAGATNATVANDTKKKPRPAVPFLQA